MMSVVVSRVETDENRTDGYLAWKMIIDSPIGALEAQHPDELQSITSTIIVEFPVAYPFVPPVIHCTDNVEHPFLGEGNRIPFKRLR